MQTVIVTHFLTRFHFGWGWLFILLAFCNTYYSMSMKRVRARARHGSAGGRAGEHSVLGVGRREASRKGGYGGRGAAGGVWGAMGAMGTADAVQTVPMGILSTGGTLRDCRRPQSQSCQILGLRRRSASGSGLEETRTLLVVDASGFGFP